MILMKKLLSVYENVSLMYMDHDLVAWGPFPEILLNFALAPFWRLSL